MDLFDDAENFLLGNTPSNKTPTRAPHTDFGTPINGNCRTPASNFGSRLKVTTPHSISRLATKFKNPIEYVGESYVAPVITDVRTTNLQILGEPPTKQFLMRDGDVNAMLARIGEQNSISALGDETADDRSHNPIAFDVIHGIIVNDPSSSESRLSGNSSYLLTTTGIINLDVSGVDKITIFPGMRVTFKGNYEMGGFKVMEVVEGESLKNAEYSGKHPTEFAVIAASGPFCEKDSSDLSKLYFLIQKAITEKASVLILIGPFVTREQFYDHDTDHETFMLELWKNIYLEIVDSGLNIVVVPNAVSDGAAFPTYPTPAFKFSEKLNDQFKERIKLVTDPATFKINGVEFAVSSPDIVNNLNATIYMKPAMNKDRIGVLCEQLLTQASFYPLFPAADDVPVIDTQAAQELLKIKRIPHVLICPSVLMQSIRCVKDCLFINPGRLVKPGGGSFLVLLFNLKSNEAIPNCVKHVKGDLFQLE
uniref:DNA polymerase alpha subunit B n=1 Tax=Rhabditophanes sp. KR3021 TaxID=114890 RepID=A0AC35TZ91_9BILA